MKAKYEKMIDEYVKKHYGDLERGVLAPEVKYKVLTKILKKKLKEKKVQVKMLRRLLQGKKEIESWGSDTCCPFYSVKVNEKEAQKEMKTCDRCKYSTFKTVTNDREAATGKMWCTKNDFETSGVTSCDWFEDKESSYLDWLHDDITWCCRECGNMDCERNTMNRKCKEGLYSAADMYDPFKCPVDAELPEVKKK